MRQNKIEQTGGRGLIVILAAVIFLALATGVVIAYGKLRDIWLEQCVIEDPTLQVTVTSGKMVKADVLAEEFGLRKGANLALIDFESKRKDILKKIPNLRSIRITRKLPGKVSISSEERSPVARMNIRGRKSETGRVVDTDGVVFIWQRGTQMLPIIRETQAPGTAVGNRLNGRALAALRLIESSQEAGRSDLGVLEIDISRPDYLVATLGNYARAKIAWDGMDDPTPANRKNLDQQLDRLAMAIRSRIGENTLIWNATDTTAPGRIYADSKGNL